MPKNKPSETITIRISFMVVYRTHFNFFFKNFVEPQDCKIGILGYGKTSKILTEYIKNIFRDIRVLTSQNINESKNIAFYKRGNHKEFLNGLTHLINLLPFTEDNANFVNLDFLYQLTNPLYYINVGRAETQNSSDIYEAAARGLIWGASIDVHGLAGGKISNQFYDLPNFFLTPHISGWTNNFWSKNSVLLKYNLSSIHFL